MLSSLNRRFNDAESNEYLVLTTMLDPSFKNKFFNDIERDNAKALLETKVSELLASNTSGTETTEPRARTSIIKVFDEILEEEGTCTATISASSLVDSYLAEPLLPIHSGNVFTWWNENKARFELLSRLALKYLSAPPTSVQSERLFSTAGDIYDEKQNHLAPERAETLLFIKSNFH